MVWLNLFFILLPMSVMAADETSPYISQDRKGYTHKCHPDYLVAGLDYATFSYTVTGDQTLEHPYYQSLTGPYFKGKDAQGVEWIGCPVFQDITNLCVKETKPWSCSCETGGDDELTFSFNMTVTKNMSGQPVWVEWKGPPVKKGQEYVLPEIRAACPTINMLVAVPSDDGSKGYLIAEQDTVKFTFELSGNNSFHTLTGPNGPQIVYTTTTGETLTACLAFDPATGACVSEDKNDGCSCEKQGPDRYLISYTKVAQLDVSEMTLYMEWPGKPASVVSEKFAFPVIKDVQEGSGQMKVEKVVDPLTLTATWVVVVGTASVFASIWGVVYMTVFHGDRNQVEAA